MKKLSVVLLLMFVSQIATAAMGSALFWEPSIGYRSETLKWTTLAGQETQFKSALPVYGLKLGFRSLIGVDVNLAGDYSKGKLDVSGLSDKADYTHQSAGVQLGVNALGLMKIYLGYSFFNEFKTEEALTLPAFNLSGPAYSAGVQFKIFSMLNFGAQYNLNLFNKISGNAYALGSETEKYFSKIDTQDYSLYLSLVF